MMSCNVVYLLCLVQGKNDSTHKVPGGSTVMTPMSGQRSAVTVPSGTRMLVPKGLNCVTRVPGGSRVLMHDYKKHQVRNTNP